MKKITIFTPSYNRKKQLPRLYDSLCRQTCRDFVWLIVDDGSADGSAELIKEWICEGKVDIKYYYQKNAGKMSAHNYGVEMTITELFFCVDSDDYLTVDAIEKVLCCWKGISGRKDIYGILAYKGYSDNKPITKVKNKSAEAVTLKDAYDKYGMTGDTALVFRSDVLKKYRFPVYEGEKFVPEAYLYDLLDQEGKLYFLHEIVYIAEYLEEGYSADINRNLYQNPSGYFEFINQRIRLDNSFKTKFLDSARYDAMAIAHNRKNIISGAVSPVFAAIAYPLGVILYKRKYEQFTK